MRVLEGRLKGRPAFVPAFPSGPLVCLCLQLSRLCVWPLVGLRTSVLRAALLSLPTFVPASHLGFRPASSCLTVAVRCIPSGTSEHLTVCPHLLTYPAD